VVSGVARRRVVVLAGEQRPQSQAPGACGQPAGRSDQK